MTIEPLSAAVLTGGHSRRMGVDKALLAFGDTPLLQRTLTTLAAVSDDVRIVGERPAYHAFGVPVVADHYANAGALGGIATALGAARYAHVLVIACDMPLLSEALLGAMAAEMRDYDILVPCLSAARSGQGSGETLDTLHAIYARNCLGKFERRIADGQLKVADALANLRVRRLDERWLRRFDPELHSLLNTNTVQDLAKARRIAGVAS